MSCRFLEDKLYQKHIDHRTGADAEEGIALPDMKQGHGGAANGLWDAEGCASKRHILQTVHHQHTHDGKGQHFSQIGDDGRRGPVLAEDQEGQKPQGGSHQSADGNGGNGVGVIHGQPPFRSSGP